MQSVFSSQTGESYRSQQHTAQVWESHKEEIRRLYLDENRPLKEVMAIMRQRGFRATVRMYKSRFDKWGFSKNNSKREVVTMLQVQRQRNALGKRTTFQRNGREIAIDAYLKRKGISQYDLAEPGIAESLPEHLRCVTPPPETPLIIQTGGALSLQELVLQTARDLAWNPYCPADFPLVTSAAVYRADALRCAITDITNADWLFHVGHYGRGGVMCEQGFKSLHLMVTQPSIFGLLHLLLFHLDAYNKGVIKESNWQGERVLELAESVLEKTKKFAYNVDFFIYIALNALAHYYRADFKPGDPVSSPKHQLSVQFLEQVCQLSEGKWDPDLGYFMGDLEKLEDWYREAGDTLMADDVHRRWRNSLELIPMQWERAH
ncbi:hypothetical protein ONZ43_g6537 [Nemania bipapillata]|uniref:Uncharacterized protein n=1 Tax=Nemania bipapillata TaxID=110536 RepID=A0ACC2HYX3_9PEZI|nr:hypothetical protein ONZ43_g6537 [Nemania bipapillata]